jgi:hypothetical protein
MWIQIKDHDEDEQFSDGATYAIHPSGVLRVNSGNDIHLYSPAYWQEITIDTQSSGHDEEQTDEVDKDIDWQ